MTARERHVALINEKKDELTKANPKGIHARDLKRQIYRLEKELKQYDKLFGSRKT